MNYTSQTRCQNKKSVLICNPRGHTGPRQRSLAANLTRWVAAGDRSGPGQTEPHLSSLTHLCATETCSRKSMAPFRRHPCQKIEPKSDQISSENYSSQGVPRAEEHVTWRQVTKSSMWGTLQDKQPSFFNKFQRKEGGVAYELIDLRHIK